MDDLLQEAKYRFTDDGTEISFLRIKDPQSVSADQCRLWTIEWKSSFAFAEFLFSCHSLRGLKILEIGAGSGLVGVCCAKLGADVLITDRIEKAAELISKNLTINELNGTVLPLDWNKLEQFPSESYDLVFGSDVLYQSRNAEGIIKLLVSNLLRDGGLAVIFCPGRGYIDRLENLSKETQNLRVSIEYLSKVKIINSDEMAELHIALIQKGDASSSVDHVKSALLSYISTRQ